MEVGRKGGWDGAEGRLGRKGVSGRREAGAEGSIGQKGYVESGISGSIREYQESRSGTRVSGVPDIRESGPTGYPGYLRDIRDIRIQDQGWGYQVLSLISLIQHSRKEYGALGTPRHTNLDLHPQATTISQPADCNSSPRRHLLKMAHAALKRGSTARAASAQTAVG
jgi:hypothetical protein